MSERTTKALKRYAFLIDTRYCNNCKTCEIACKMERRLPTGQRWREVRRYEGTGASGASVNHAINVPMACNHCEQPRCVDVCPMNAYRKMPMGMVIQNNAVCIGCTKCVAACPYSAPVFNPATGRTGKCDMCYDRLEAGMQPFCVQCCPNNALKLDTYENLVAAYGARQDIYEFDDGRLVHYADTNPSIVIKL